VLSGYDGRNSLPNPTMLFYSIVYRFSPSTIAGIFFGHTHEDQLMIYYDYSPNATIASNTSSIICDATLVDCTKPLAGDYIEPFITPLTRNNAGWVLVTIDSSAFSVTNYQTYFANVSEANSWATPV